MLASRFKDDDYVWVENVDGNFTYVDIFDAYENGISTDAVSIVQGKYGGWRLVIAVTPIYSIAHDKTFACEIDAMEEYRGILSGNWFVARCVNTKEL
jgi:hypothetical protein